MSTSGQVIRLRAPLITDPYSQLPTKRDWTNPARLPLGGDFEVDPGGSVETDLVNRIQIVTTPKLYGPVDADLDASDRVEAAGVVYEVDGHPARWPGGALCKGGSVWQLKRIEG